MLNFEGFHWNRFGLGLGGLALVLLVLALVFKKQRPQYLQMLSVLAGSTLFMLVWLSLLYNTDREHEWQFVAEVAALAVGLFVLNMIRSFKGHWPGLLGGTAQPTHPRGPTPKDQQALGRVCAQIADSYSDRSQSLPAFTLQAAGAPDRRTSLPSASAHRLPDSNHVILRFAEGKVSLPSAIQPRSPGQTAVSTTAVPSSSAGKNTKVRK